MSFGDFHPLVIHFPIALLSTSFFFDVLQWKWPQRGFHHVSFWNLSLGLAASIAAVATGFAADLLVGHMEWPFDPLKTHGVWQLTSLVIFMGLWIPARRQISVTDSPILPISTLVIKGLAVALLFYGSHLGAILADRI